MAITFTSKASGDVTMLDANAKEVLEILGKALESRGVITAGDAGASIAALQAAVAARSATPGPGADEEEEEVPPMQKRVPFATRVFPLIELLEKSRAKGADVLWGV